MKKPAESVSDARKNTKQRAAFRKAARDLGCDNNEDRFKDALRTVAKAKPSEKGERLSPNRDKDKGP